MSETKKKTANDLKDLERLDKKRDPACEKGARLMKKGRGRGK